MSISVLAIDDEPMNNEAVARALRKRTEVELVTCESPADALAHLQARVFELLLVDYSMAGMNGVEFVERARSLRPEAFVVMVTGYPELTRVVEAHASGIIDSIVAKPWRPEDLNAALDGFKSIRNLRSVRDRMMRTDKGSG